MLVSADYIFIQGPPLEFGVLVSEVSFDSFNFCKALGGQMFFSLYNTVHFTSLQIINVLTIVEQMKLIKIRQHTTCVF